MVRPATLADLDSIVALHLAAFRAGNGPYVSAATLERLTPAHGAAAWRPVVELERAARAHLRERGFGAATLWTVDGNARARRFYERHGWQPDGARAERMGATVVRYRTGLGPTPCAPARG